MLVIQTPGDGGGGTIPLSESKQASSCVRVTFSRAIFAFIDCYNASGRPVMKHGRPTVDLNCSIPHKISCCFDVLQEFRFVGPLPRSPTHHTSPCSFLHYVAQRPDTSKTTTFTHYHSTCTASHPCQVLWGLLARHGKHAHHLRQSQIRIQECPHASRPSIDTSAFDC